MYILRKAPASLALSSDRSCHSSSCSGRPPLSYVLVVLSQSGETQGPLSLDNNKIRNKFIGN